MKNLHKLIRFTILSVVLVLQANSQALAQDLAAAARANRARAASATPESEWYGLTRASLSYEEKGVMYTSNYEISGNDLKITLESRGKQDGTAEIMLITGQCLWMLTKNGPIERGHEIDVLKGQILNLRLALELLRAAIPRGPSQITSKTPVTLDEQNRPLFLSTSSANGGIEAAWALQGTIDPIAPQELSFELTLKTSDTLHISGTWQKDATPLVFADETPLDGWQLMSVGPTATADANGGILDYGAQLSDKHPKTLGELRAITAR